MILVAYQQNKAKKGLFEKEKPENFERGAYV